MKSTKECLPIEDDVDDQEIFKMAVDRLPFGVQCTMASSGEDALETLRAGYKPDVIFIDMNMPLMDGMECLEQIRKIPSLQATRLCLYSTSEESHVVGENKLSKADDFIVKPPTLKDLIAILSEVFEKIK